MITEVHTLSSASGEFCFDSCSSHFCYQLHLSASSNLAFRASNVWNGGKSTLLHLLGSTPAWSNLRGRRSRCHRWYGLWRRGCIGATPSHAKQWDERIRRASSRTIVAEQDRSHLGRQRGGHDVSILRSKHRRRCRQIGGRARSQSAAGEKGSPRAVWCQQNLRRGEQRNGWEGTARCTKFLKMCNYLKQYLAEFIDRSAFGFL